MSDFSVLNFDDTNYDVKDLNGRKQLASLYDTTLEYRVGAMTIYNGLLYKCIVPVAAGSQFDLTKWENIPIAERIWIGETSELAAEEEYITPGTIIFTTNDTQIVNISSISLSKDSYDAQNSVWKYTISRHVMKPDTFIKCGVIIENNDTCELLSSAVYPWYPIVKDVMTVSKQNGEWVPDRNTCSLITNTTTGEDVTFSVNVPEGDSFLAYVRAFMILKTTDDKEVVVYSKGNCSDSGFETDIEIGSSIYEPENEKYHYLTTYTKMEDDTFIQYGSLIEKTDLTGINSIADAENVLTISKVNGVWTSDRSTAAHWHQENDPTRPFRQLSMNVSISNQLPKYYARSYLIYRNSLGTEVVKYTNAIEMTKTV